MKDKIGKTLYLSKNKITGEEIYFTSFQSLEKLIEIHSNHEIIDIREDV